MNIPNRVKISINGVHYSISTAEPEEYVQELARELDEQIHSILDKNPNISFNDVMVLCAINYVDGYKRSEENADRMRSQITEYLEDAAKARIELDEAKRELAHLRRQLEQRGEKSAKADQKPEIEPEMKGQTRLDVK